MKSLYSRFVFMTVGIMLLSSIIGFLLTNVYYQVKLKPYNSEKILNYAEEVKSLYEKQSEENKYDYLQSIAKLGYEIYIVDDQMNGKRIGNAFRKITISDDTVRKVLQGETFNGVSTYPTRLFITGFFDNELINSVGVPLKHGDKQYALFIRPDIQQQFGEMRIFLAVLLGFIVLLSIIFIAIAAGYIVRPIRKFTKATQKIASGEYEIELDVKRKDEIGTLSTSFQKMTKSIKELDEMRQEFVSNVSHEFQSPLSSIQGFSKTLQTEKMSEEERNHYLQIIEGESKRMSSLCKQLLTLASLDKEEKVLQIKEFNLQKQIKDVIFMLEWKWREKDIAVEFDVPDITIKGDENLLHQVWSNIFMNSIKFSNDAGTIEFFVEELESSVIISISDNGIGMEKEEMDRIFDRFYKVDTARARNVEGSGLGLSIVQKIVELHHGNVSVYSTKGEGTTVRVELPK
ncbi:sensor histidine kinase [Bacillus toyonensis]|uniref:sensor histidine kinase n=1 Tax=Bacillus toyonensis TaxID=155322 RepID=UPI000B43FE40|nr:HAMP domain-containing sensor histidine kinase [Bacillus toyonensis]OTX10140.1 sensor histidine kinase [Bacillus thuringiensis serovar seoulensis]MCA1045735.1 HAMP domain-containing histidine kinase [Bacillus toyonensis]MDO8160692.1 HAMP domain-containing histidine kinase [Bacillus toyonensis]MED3197856.1 HAMP domain-containing sensor histidine kinase [Bacillus toyonensis]PHG61208.1 sensor histidine kinase [Bacillus toyonensis]